MVCFGMRYIPKLDIASTEREIVDEFETVISKGFKREGVQMSLLGKRVFTRQKDGLFLFAILIVAPRFYLWSLPLFVMSLLFGLPGWTYIFSVVFLLTGIVYHPIYYFMLAKLRLRRLGFKGKIKFVNGSSALEELMFDGSARSL